MNKKKFDRVPQVVMPDGYEPEHTVVTLGGHEVTVYKMSLGSFARAVRIAEPYVKEITEALFGTPAFQKVTSGETVDPKVLEEEMRTAAVGKLTEMVAAVPETVMKFLACIMNVPEEGDMADFFWNVVDPGDLLGAIEKLDELNNFADVANRLMKAMQYLGQRYGIELPGISIVEKEQGVEKED